MKYALALVLFATVAFAQTAPKPQPSLDTERRLSITSIHSSVNYCRNNPSGIAWVYDNLSTGNMHGWRSEDCSTFAQEVKDIFPEVLYPPMKPKKQYRP
jgi:hypothetical protein